MSTGLDPYATLDWLVEDGHGGVAEASLLIHVAALNDPPIPVNQSAYAYIGLSRLIQVNGTDVDGEDPSNPIADARVLIVSLPTHGTLRELNNADDTPGSLLSAGTTYYGTVAVLTMTLLTRAPA